MIFEFIMNRVLFAMVFIYLLESYLNTDVMFKKMSMQLPMNKKTVISVKQQIFSLENCGRAPVIGDMVPYWHAMVQL